MNNVIDLTDDHAANSHTRSSRRADVEASSSRMRTGRYDREVIDLSTETSPAPPETDDGTAEEEDEADYSDDIAPRLPRESRQVHPHMDRDRGQRRQFRRASSSEVVFVSERPRSNTPQFPPQHRRDVLDLTAENDDDDVVHVRTTGRLGANFPPPLGRGTVAARRSPEALGMAQLLAAHRQGNGRLADRVHAYRPVFARAERHYLEDDFDVLDGPGPAQRHETPHPNRPFVAPGAMNYNMVGFGLGGNVGMGAREPTPEYNAPLAAQPGFTRSPAEDEVVVCPSCGDELALGESEEKRQVWIVKACGHVRSLTSPLFMTC